MKRVCAIFSLFWGFGLCLCAQSVYVEKPVVISTEEMYKAVEVSNVLHAVEGSTAIYKIIVAGYDSITSVTSLYYNTTDVTSYCHLDKGVLTIDDISITDLKANETQDFKVTLIVREKGKETDTERSAEAMVIKVYPIPTVTPSPESNTLDSPVKKFVGGSWNLSVLTVGGNADGWKIEWKDADSGELLGHNNDYVISSTATNNIETKHILLHVMDISPDSTQHSSWFDEIYHYYIRFYPVPLVEYKERYPQNVLDGERIQMEVKLVDDTQMKDDYVIYYDWGNDITTSMYLFEASNTESLEGAQETILTKCTFGLKDTDLREGSQELLHSYMVWPKPSVIVSESSNSPANPKYLFQDGKWDLSVSSFGGYPTGWKYEWKDEKGNVVSDSVAYTLLCENTSEYVQERHVTLIVTNEPQDRTDLWWNQTYDYYAKYYPAPIVEINKDYPRNIKNGEKVALNVSVLDSKGNSVTDAYDLSYSWNNGQSQEASFEYIGENPNNYDGVKVTIKVNCTVQFKGTNSGQSYSRQADIIVWPLPKVDFSDISDRVGCGGQSMDFPVHASGGKKDGWSFEWTLNGQQLNVSTGNYYLSLDDVSVERMVDNYKVRVINICDGELWCDTTRLFNVTVYPTPRTPDDIVIMDENRGVEVSTGIREGNSLILHCDECSGGYPNGWSYKWMRNNSELGTLKDMNETVISGYSGNGKSNDMFLEYSCAVENIYNTIPWVQQTYKKEIRVYRKPQTPTSLRRKGNGTSGTLIATCGMDDASLGINDYYLVFGYRDANGEMHDVSSVSQQNVGEQRWCSVMNSSGYTDGRNNAYVYALWKYSDGVEVTSGLCMESHVEESWDGSTYNGVTRSVIADATGIKKLSSDPVSSINSKYYTVNGQKSDRMQKGLNIIRRNDGKFVKYVNNR